VTPGLPLRTFAWHPPTGYPDRWECGCLSSLERNTRSVLFGVCWEHGVLADRGAGPHGSDGCAEVRVNVSTSAAPEAASSSDARWAAWIERSRWHRRNGRTSPSRSSCCSRRFRAPWTSRSGRVVTSLKARLACSHSVEAYERWRGRGFTDATDFSRIAPGPVHPLPERPWCPQPRCRNRAPPGSRSSLPTRELRSSLLADVLVNP
jgi:hypothetical protein